MASNVYLARVDDHTDTEEMARLAGRVFDEARLDRVARQHELTAVKTHYGEEGNDSWVGPECVRPFIERLQDAGARTALIETSTLYTGERHNALDHFELACRHGFGYEELGCPILFMDGLRGDDEREVEVCLKRFDEVALSVDFPHVPSALVVSHLTGHILAGVGGAIKNVAMGLCSRKGKLRQHISGKPTIDEETCTACGTCAEWCPEDAITVRSVAEVNHDDCIGCGQCLTVCPVDAVDFAWDEDSSAFCEGMAEYARGILKHCADRTGYVTFATDVTVECNCEGKEMERIAPDVGILASHDPVAIDRAAVELTNEAAGRDVFKEAWPDRDYEAQLSHGESIGLGADDYELKEI